MHIKLFPWDNDENHYWTNPENGIEWYIDRATTEYCSSSKGSLPPLDAICFYVCEKKNNEVVPLSRVLLCKKTNGILCEETGLEQMICKIDVIRLLKSDTNEQFNINRIEKCIVNKKGCNKNEKQ